MADVEETLSAFEAIRSKMLNGEYSGTVTFLA